MSTVIEIDQQDILLRDAHVGIYVVTTDSRLCMRGELVFVTYKGLSCYVIGKENSFPVYSRDWAGWDIHVRPCKIKKVVVE